MPFVKDRFNYLFKSTKGLILVAMAMISLETALFGLLSGPMSDLAVRAIGIDKAHIFVIKSNEAGKVFWRKIGWQERDDLMIMSKLTHS